MMMSHACYLLEESRRDVARWERREGTREGAGSTAPAGESLNARKKWLVSEAMHAKNYTKQFPALKPVYRPFFTVHTTGLSTLFLNLRKRDIQVYTI